MSIHTTDQGWVLETATTGYALGLNAAGLLTHRYWGRRLTSPDDYPPAPNPLAWASFNSAAQSTPEEYPGYAGETFIDPCIKVTFADGVRDVVLRFESAEQRDGDQPELRIILRDTAYPLRVTLHYRVHHAHDLIERWATATNEGDAPISIERMLSAEWHLPPGSGYRLSHLTGRWADEMNLRREPLVQGLKVLESRRINTSHHHSPWFAIDRGAADEDSGQVWFGALAWSGNWKIVAEVTDFDTTRVKIGLNDWDFAWRLGAGEQFVTPSSFAGYSDAGFGKASRSFHDLVRAQLLPHGDAVRQVLYNSWEATLFDVDERSQVELARLAAEMGVELFVMDDGWFHGRTSDRAGLGDWWPDAVKFPSGLSPLIAQVNALGMQFGLWVEPEMVNPDSELYRAHPDWVIHFPTRARTEGRNQLILNVARQDVQGYLIDTIDRLLTEHNIAFIKWDMNRSVSEPGWPDAPGDQREIWVRYVQGLYHIWGTLRARHPQVIWQSCSGGGARADLGILRLADQIWASDNTEPTARLQIQEGFSQVFPASTMESWVTDMGPEYLPLSFRFHVSMCGSLGVGGHLVHWGAARRAEAAGLIALYKAIRHIVHQGDMYRLRSPHDHAFSAVQYVSKDKAEGVLFAFRTHIPRPANLPPIYLRGLDPDARYEVEGFAGARSGRAWMEAGLTLELADFGSTARRITEALRD
ncbi:alpha-galactosidase [Oscillochloris sp. ZM17-4]|uniref:alpha-galactosidase n=1 Tax=Oscillochloris sp. ZM17-4 TaxID=2866714 RepID=UPI001C73D32C|nr:alpha-galactosidase [Oscillochloris sp. ZM17-4]MBX0328488.1 alpha-galactosidase [Oscillochloris sp. ZM17-4]